MTKELDKHTHTGRRTWWIVDSLRRTLENTHVKTPPKHWSHKRLHRYRLIKCFQSKGNQCWRQLWKWVWVSLGNATAPQLAQSQHIRNGSVVGIMLRRFFLTLLSTQTWVCSASLGGMLGWFSHCNGTVSVTSWEMKACTEKWVPSLFTSS